MGRTPAQELFDAHRDKQRLWFGVPNERAHAELAHVIQQHPMQAHRNGGLHRFAAVVSHHAREAALRFKQRGEALLAEQARKQQA